MKNYYAVFRIGDEFEYIGDVIRCYTKTDAENIAIQRGYSFNLITKRKQKI
jgi:hypothetical protein